MEQDCVTGLYCSLGMSVGAEFSTEDVRLLYHKVFHVPSDISEAQAAIKKFAGVDSSWACVGENVLDVLLEMEREREQKEMLYWDLQLLNAANLHHMMDYLHQSPDPSILKKASDTGPLDSLQMGRLAQKVELWGNMAGTKGLKKSARQCWARLASEGVQSILPSPWQNHKAGIRGQAWGCISLSDILLLVEVKYDVVTHLLYTEMLQEHHTESVWETLVPWQQRKEVEWMEELVEEALDSVDMLQMAELPGAFRIYKACLSACGSYEHSWSAVSLLHELHTFHQHERDTLAILSEQLHEESLSLLCLHIRLATLRAQREKMSYGAFLAARQSWEMWPNVNNPCRAEQAALWLHEEEEEDKEDFKLQQSALLQLLVLTQEQERKHLVRLVHGVSLEDLQEPSCPVPPKEDNNLQTTLRNGCIKRLKQIRAQLQTNVSQVKSQHRLQDQEEWSQSQLGNCALLLLTLLTELQEIQTTALLQALMDRNPHRVHALREEYESEIQEQRLTNLLHLLISDAPLTSSSILNRHLNMSGNGTNENITVQPSSGGSPKDQADSSVNLNDAQTADGTDKQDLCSGCGIVMEELPYLEILCVSDPKSNTPENIAAKGRVQEEEGEGSALNNYEKQGSLITLAWSKPAEDKTADGDGGTGQSKDGETSLGTQVQPAQCEEKVPERDSEEPIQLQSSSDGQHDAEQVASGNQPDQEECDLDLVAVSLQATKPQSDSATDGRTVTAETCPSESEYQNYSPEETSLSDKKTMKERPVSAVERERTMRSLVDMQRKVEQRQQRDRERQLLRVQERLSIVQNRKAEEDLLGLKHTERLKHLTQDLPLEDKNQQKTVVKERLEQLRRERSNIMQSKRDRNTAGFKELLGPVAFHGKEAEDGADRDTTAI